MHVHVYHAEGEAKFWLEPRVARDELRSESAPLGKRPAARSGA